MTGDAVESHDGDSQWWVAPPRGLPRGRRNWLRELRPGALDRFDTERFQTELDRLWATWSSSGQPPASIDQVVQVAMARWSEGRHDAAWSALKAVDRELVDRLDAPSLAFERSRVLKEAQDKLGGWRLATIEECLKEDLGCDEGGTPESLASNVKAARRVLDGHLDNVHLRERLLKGHVQGAGVVLLLVLLGLVVVLGVLAWTEWAVDGLDPFSNLADFCLVAALGAFGAAVSGVVRFVARDVSLGIPRLKAERTLIWLRPLVGAAAAVVVVAVLLSGLAGLEVTNDASLLVYALVSGFSEALVSRTVAKVTASIAG